MEELTDLSQFKWIAENVDQDLHPESPWSYVSEYLPVNYPAYCKIFHAIYEDLSITDKSITWDEVSSKGSSDSSDEVSRVKWQDLATEFSLEFHPEMNQDSFALNFLKGSWPRYLIAPREGTLDEEECPDLSQVLAPFSNDQPCYFFYDPNSRSAANDFIGVIYHGGLDEVDALSSEGTYYTTPTYWWPEDKRWAVFTDPDYTFTIVGGPQELIDAIMVNPGLEAVAVQLSTRITPNSDQVNIHGDAQDN
mgnify:CR=1 FL=1